MHAFIGYICRSDFGHAGSGARVVFLSYPQALACLALARQFVFGAAEESAHGTDYPVREEHDDYDEDCG